MGINNDKYPEPDRLIIKKNTETETPRYSLNEEKTYHYNDREVPYRMKKRTRISILLIINVCLIIVGGLILRFLIDTDTAYKEYNGFVFVLRIVTVDSNRRIQLKVQCKDPSSSLAGSAAVVRFYIPEKTDTEKYSFTFPAELHSERIITSSIPVYAGDTTVAGDITGTGFSFNLVKKK